MSFEEFVSTTQVRSLRELPEELLTHLAGLIEEKAHLFNQRRAEVMRSQKEQRQ